jgi:hypothetical protein
MSNSQKTQSVSITKTNRLMLFREIIAVCYGNHTEHVDPLCGHIAESYNDEAGDTYC